MISIRLNCASIDIFMKTIITTTPGEAVIIYESITY